jgi:hypothetical protein
MAAWMPTTPPAAAAPASVSISCASSAWRPVKLAMSRGGARDAAAAKAPGSCPRLAVSTSAAGALPRAAAAAGPQPHAISARGIGLVPIRALAIQVRPLCAAWPACLWCVFGGGWLHAQRWRSIQAAYVQLLCIDEYRVLLLLRFLRGLLCQF